MHDDLIPPPVAENPWKLALEGSGVGVWDWNIVNGSQTHSAHWEEMLGYQAGELNRGYQDFADRVHPDDLARVQTAAATAVQGKVAKYAIDFRMLCKDGSWKWILSCGTVVQHDASGKPLRMIGTHTDITERKQSENALREANAQLVENTQLLETTLTSISQGILLTDASDIRHPACAGTAPCPPPHAQRKRTLMRAGQRVQNQSSTTRATLSARCSTKP